MSKESSAWTTVFCMFPKVSSDTIAGSTCPVSIKWGAPVVYFCVRARNVCLPSQEIYSTLYSSPSINSSITARFSNDCSSALFTASLISDRSVIFVTPRLPDRSTGFTISGRCMFCSISSVISSERQYLGDGSLFAANALRIRYLFVEIFALSIPFPIRFSFSAT